MFTVVSAAIILAMVLTLIRGLRGPTLYDRILALNTFGTKTALMIAVLGYLMNRPYFLDIALLYVLLNFIGPIAILKFFEYGELGGSGRQETGAGE